MLTVLIADDEHHICNYIASLLQSQNWDLDIHTAYSGIEAMEAIENTVFHLMLLDIDMPGASGLDVAKEAASRYPRTRILFLTAYDNFDYIYSAVSLNCRGYFLKIEPEHVILEKIQNVIEEIQNEQLRMGQIDDMNPDDLLVSFLTQQSILDQICTGRDLSQLKARTSVLSPVVSPQMDTPFYLMYLHHSLSPRQTGEGFFADKFLAQRIQLMHALLCGKMRCYTYRSDGLSFFFLFQPTQPIARTSDLVLLKHVTDEFISNIPAVTSPIQETAILYTQPLALHEISEKVSEMKTCGVKMPPDTTSYVTFLDAPSLKKLLDQPPARSRYAKNEQLMKRIESYIDKNYASKLTLSSIAALVSYNESYISRLFKKETGKGVVEYITAVRLQKAKELLLSTSSNVQDIALAVGFDTPQYFSSIFKRQEGFSPTEYRLFKRPHDPDSRKKD